MALSASERHPERCRPILFAVVGPVTLSQDEHVFQNAVDALVRRSHRTKLLWDGVVAGRKIGCLFCAISSNNDARRIIRSMSHTTLDRSELLVGQSQDLSTNYRYI
jgi:hypothetical protein